MKTFEEFLRDEVWHPEGVLDDDMPDAFETWLCDQDGEELINWADVYGKLKYEQGKSDGLDAIIIKTGEL